MRSRRTSSALGLLLLAGCSLPVVPCETASPPAPGVATQAVELRLDSPVEGAALVKTSEGGGVVCEAPCLRIVTIEEGATYRIMAPAHQPTGPFSLYMPEDDEVWLTHQATHADTFWALRGAAIGSTALGLTAWGIAAGMATQSGPRSDDRQAVMTTLGVGGIVLTLGVGVPLWFITDAFSESGEEFRDPALPGFRF